MVLSRIFLKTNFIFIFTAICLMTSGCEAREADMEKDPYWSKRDAMVTKTIEARGVRDPRVLDAMRSVERHQFVPKSALPFAYEDYPLPIGESQTISQPYIVAFMTELLELDGSEKILELGTGSGYQAAVLSKVAKEVYTIEIIHSLADRAGKTLKELGYDNVHVRRSDGFHGWSEEAPFDAIIITFAVPEIPSPVIEQLAEGGILVAPEGDWYQEIIILRKEDGKIKRERSIPVRFVPMLRE
jgi:protein-L-isoaspartate(D-aspartate) O-methyltransferase